jgi:polysaccharide export outer membrane protein
MYLIAVQTTAQALALLGFVQTATAQIAPVPPLPPAVEAPAPRVQTETPPPGQPGPQTQVPAPQRTTPGNGAPAASVLPPDYVIGPEDVVSVLFWRDKEMSGDYVVRPDGQITLPLLSDVRAAGLTPEQLRAELTKAAAKYLEDPNVTVGIKVINSRKVHITGMVGKAGSYPLTGPTTVLQLIAMAGGLQEFANGKKILIVRQENGQQVAYKFNYNDVRQGKNLQQNIALKPGDIVVVP